MKMSLGMIFLLIVIVILVIVLVFILFKPQTYVERFSTMFSNFMNGQDGELADNLVAKLKLGEVKEVELEGVESRFRYKIENAGYNRIVIIVLDKNANAYLDNTRVGHLLEENKNTRSLVGMSAPNSGVQLVEVVQSAESSIDPQVFLGSAAHVSRTTSPIRKTSQRVTMVEDDLLSGI